MKKLLSVVLSLAMIICSLPAASIAFAADDAITHSYSDVGMMLVANDFNNLAGENLPTSSNASFYTASKGEKDSTNYRVNNGLTMIESYGPEADGAIEFIGDASGYPGAFINLNDQFFGAATLGKDGYAGLTEGVVVTEFDIMANSLQHLALLGTGTTSSSSIATSSADAYIFTPSGNLGNSKIPYNVGEWGRVKIVSNLTRKSLAMYYNDVLIHSATANHGYGLKELGGLYGIMFQGAGSGLIDFAIDNMTISYENVVRLGTAAFDNFTMANDYRLDGAFAPRAYVTTFDFGATVASIADGKGGNGNKAMKMVPNGASNPNYRYYFQNTPYKGAKTGVFHGQFDIKLESNFKVTLSEGWGLSFGDEIFSTNGKAGSATYNNTDWYHVDVITDYETGVLKVYLDGNVIKTVSAPKAMMASEYFQIIVWGNAEAGSNGVLFDNITFDYYQALPKFESVAGFKTEAMSDYIVASEVAANATGIRYDLSGAFTKVDADDIIVTVDGAVVEADASVSGSTLDVEFASAIGAGKEVVVTVLGSATVGVCSPANKEISKTITTTEEDYVKPVNPYAAMEVDELTIFPADGKYVYDENKLTLKAYGPEGISDAKFYLDGAEVADLTNFDNMYYIDLPSANIANGDHTFKVVATINGASVTKEAKFSFYSGESILVYNTFDELTSTPEATNCNVRTASAYGPSSSLWTFNNYMIPGLDTGKGGKGKALRFTNAVDGAYAGGQIALDDLFFGVTTLGKDGYPGGISEGYIVTEFDLKINTSGQLGFLGLGCSSSTNISTSGGAIALSADTGKWVHVTVYTNYAEKSTMTVIDGKIVHDNKGTSYPYGNKELWGRFGLMFQAKNAIDFSIDNFTIKYSNVHEIGHSEFDAYTGSLGQPDGAMIPRGYVPMYDKGSATVELSKGFMGGKAISIAPNGGGNPNYRFYYQNKAYKGATTGVLHASFDIKADAFMDVALSDGFGLFFSNKVLGADGKAGAVDYKTGEWYHMDLYTDWNNNRYDIYLNNVLTESGSIPYAFLRNEYFQIIVWGNAEAGNAAVHFDNISFDYYEGPMFGKEATMNVDGSVITVPMSANYASLEASDVTLSVNGAAAEVSAVEVTDAGLKITSGTNVSASDKVKVTIGSEAKLGTIAIQNKAYTKEFDGLGFTIDANDPFACYGSSFKYGKNDSIYLDDQLVAVYNHNLSENEVLNNATVTVTKDGAPCNVMTMIGVEGNKVVISFSGLEANASYKVEVKDVVNANLEVAQDFAVEFTTAPFALKADDATVENGVAKAKVYSAYANGKTVRIVAANYDGNKLTGVTLGDAKVSTQAGEVITLDLTDIGGNADKVFVWDGLAPLN